MWHDSATRKLLDVLSRHHPALVSFNTTKHSAWEVSNYILKYLSVKVNKCFKCIQLSLIISELLDLLFGFLGGVPGVEWVWVWGWQKPMSTQMAESKGWVLLPRYQSQSHWFCSSLGLLHTSSGPCPCCRNIINRYYPECLCESLFWAERVLKG